MTVPEPPTAEANADFWFMVAVNTATRAGQAYRTGREDAARDVETAMYAESERLASPAEDASLHQRGRAVDWGIGVAKAVNTVIAAARGDA